MGWPFGERRVEEGLNELGKTLEDYFGALNQIKEGVNVKIPDKPEALLLLQKCRAIGVPLVEGGLIDQPFIWLQEVAVVTEVTQLFEMLEKAKNQPPQQQGV